MGCYISLKSWRDPLILLLLMPGDHCAGHTGGPVLFHLRDSIPRCSFPNPLYSCSILESETTFIVITKHLWKWNCSKTSKGIWVVPTSSEWTFRPVARQCIIESGWPILSPGTKREWKQPPSCHLLKDPTIYHSQLGSIHKALSVRDQQLPIHHPRDGAFKTGVIGPSTSKQWQRWSPRMGNLQEVNFDCGFKGQ